MQLARAKRHLLFTVYLVHRLRWCRRWRWRRRHGGARGGQGSEQANIERIEAARGKGIEQVLRGPDCAVRGRRVGTED